MQGVPSIQQLLDAVKARHNLRSDYALAKFLRVSKSTCSNWAAGVTSPDDMVALQIADELELDQAYTLALVHANRHRYGNAVHVWIQLFELAKANALSQGREVL